VQISPAAKQYAQNIIDYDTFQKNQLGPVQSVLQKNYLVQINILKCKKI
tara:strand:+ start:2510 stop:2656 length:147 start_codon:yes stop_codon:yes gene_type:complete